MAGNNPFLRKLADIRYSHGRKAADYFQKNCVCQGIGCLEERIACLTIHHVAGKEKEVFKTLCLNCHALLHAHKSGSYTGKDFFIQKELWAKEKLWLNTRNKNITEAVKAGMSYRKAGKMFGVTHQTIRDVYNNLKGKK